MAVLCGEPAVGGYYVAERMNFLVVAGRVRCNFGGLFSIAAGALKVFADLLAAWTRCVKILLRVAFDLRRATSARRNFVTKLSYPIGQFRLIDCCRELL